MVPKPALHDAGTKQLLRGLSLPAGQTPEGDLAAALSNVFLHPNVGPFLGTQLIRQLVTSNPSPAYVARVTRGIREQRRGRARRHEGGRARDPARSGGAHRATDPDLAYGRFKEPVLYVVGLLRSLGANSDGIGLDEITRSMGQNVFYPPTVFNYYPADYKVPGTTLIAPPMGIHNTNTVLARSNFVSRIVYEGGLDPSDEVPGSVGTSLMTDAYETLAPDPKALVAALEERLFGGVMPPNMKNEIYLAVSAIDASDTRERARTAIYLAATALQYQVSR